LDLRHIKKLNNNLLIIDDRIGRFVLLFTKFIYISKYFQKYLWQKNMVTLLNIFSKLILTFMKIWLLIFWLIIKKKRYFF